MVLGLKLGVSLILLVMGLVCGRLPLRMKQGPETYRRFSYANCFAAGIFIGAGLIHMLGDASDLLSSLWDFPVAFTLAAVGFFLVFGIDRLLGHGEHHSALSPYILTLVLSVHSLIAGTAVGLEPQLAGAAILLMAILFHKGSAAFALGVRLAKSGLPREKSTAAVSLFASMTPIGVLLGLVLARQLEGPTAHLWEGLFDALAAGTFLYVAIMEVLADEFARHENQATKYLLALAGLSVMVILAIWS